MSGNVVTLLNALKLSSEKVKKLKEELAEAESGGAENVDELRQKAIAAEVDENAVKNSLLDEWNEQSERNITSVVPEKPSPVQYETPDLSTSLDKSTLQSCGSNEREPANSQSSHFTTRIPPPKQYQNGENFTTWCSRFKRYLSMGKVANSLAHEMLLNSVDDRTLEKLEPVAEKLTRAEKRDPEKFIQIFEQAMNPKSEIRALRQELSGRITQGEDEDTEAFAARIRSLANKAYSEPAERQEPCLNAFLNGLKDDTLYDKVVAVPGAEDNFELAVQSASKFEKMRRSRNVNSTVNVADNSSDLLQGVFQVDRLENTQTAPRNEIEYSQQQNRSGDRRQIERQPIRNQIVRQPNSRPETNPRSRVEMRTCYRCDVQGHIARFCPNNPLNTNRAGMTN